MTALEARALYAAERTPASLSRRAILCRKRTISSSTYPKYIHNYIYLFLVCTQTFSFFRLSLFINFTENTLANIRLALYSNLIKLPMHFFSQKRVGELNSRISSDITQIQETLRTTIAEFFRQVIIILGGVAFLFMISWKLALIMLGTFPVMAVLAVIFGRLFVS